MKKILHYNINLLNVCEFSRSKILPTLTAKSPSFWEWRAVQHITRVHNTSLHKLRRKLGTEMWESTVVVGHEKNHVVKSWKTCRRCWVIDDSGLADLTIEKWSCSCRASMEVSCKLSNSQPVNQIFENENLTCTIGLQQWLAPQWSRLCWYWCTCRCVPLRSIWSTVDEIWKYFRGTLRWARGSWWEFGFGGGVRSKCAT